MLELKFIRNNPDLVRADLTKRGDEEKLLWIDDLLAKDIKSREMQTGINTMRARRNVISREINDARKAKEDFSGLLEEAKSLPARIKEDEAELEEINAKLKYYRMRIPNLLHETVPVGADDSENVEVKKWGEAAVPSFELKNHGELAVEKNLAEFERAARISGSGFYMLKGNLALMDLALQRLAIDLLTGRGYTPIIPPYMMNRAAYEGVTDLADFENVMYAIDGEDEFLIATSEHPMAAMYMDEIFEEKDLPIRMAGISPCFRREIGAHGLDTRGLFRVHQFNKVEQFIYCKEEDSWAMHEELLKNSEDLYQMLGLPYRVVNICTGDIGTVAAKKYDMEVWMPREETYREVVSCSNCTAYQSVRLNIKVRDAHDFETKNFVHTLNSTAVATTRTLRAIMENYQEEDGTVVVPEVLRPYMNGAETL
ncbi:serine--tRNA ligase [Methanoplanus endosymbiosus]|uniref:Serine--tRNA ligase n=1 Tax=Methanoplanus endosymbiosus TaxID=33865 RepID=A0A9E7PKM5_9EURY|nr:serine--tRNA ligase [Methanoplanus endosymbiosus]UUX91898.1 serine--tRNA ligase [Methanoplanus endosymbiosus]